MLTRTQHQHYLHAAAVGLCGVFENRLRCSCSRHSRKVRRHSTKTHRTCNLHLLTSNLKTDEADRLLLGLCRQANMSIAASASQQALMDGAKNGSAVVLPKKGLDIKECDMSEEMKQVRTNWNSIDRSIGLLRCCRRHDCPRVDVWDGVV